MKHWMLLAALPACVAAQPMDQGTYDVYFQQLSAAGKLEGCSLVFTTIVNDTAYLNGAQVILNGSIAYRTFQKPNQLLFTGKLGTKPLLQQSGPWHAPSHFYFSTKSGSTAGRAKIVDADTPGYRLLIADTDEQTINMFGDMMNSGELTVGFNRTPAGQDIYSAIKLNVSLKKDAGGNAKTVQSNETPAQFNDCMGRLIAAIKR
jgi:hypothetical protein